MKSRQRDWKKKSPNRRDKDKKERSPSHSPSASRSRKSSPTRREEKRKENFSPNKKRSVPKQEAEPSPYAEWTHFTETQHLRVKQDMKVLEKKPQEDDKEKNNIPDSVPDSTVVEHKIPLVDAKPDRQNRNLQITVKVELQEGEQATKNENNNISAPEQKCTTNEKSENQRQNLEQVEKKSLIKPVQNDLEKDNGKTAVNSGLSGTKHIIYCDSMKQTVSKPNENEKKNLEPEGREKNDLDEDNQKTTMKSGVSEVSATKCTTDSDSTTSEPTGRQKEDFRKTSIENYSVTNTGTTDEDIQFLRNQANDVTWNKYSIDALTYKRTVSESGGETTERSLTHEELRQEFHQKSRDSSPKRLIQTEKGNTNTRRYLRNIWRGKQSQESDTIPSVAEESEQSDHTNTNSSLSENSECEHKKTGSKISIVKTINPELNDKLDAQRQNSKVSRKEQSNVTFNDSSEKIQKQFEKPHTKSKAQFSGLTHEQESQETSNKRMKIHHGTPGHNLKEDMQRENDIPKVAAKAVVGQADVKYRTSSIRHIPHYKDTKKVKKRIFQKGKTPRDNYTFHTSQNEQNVTNKSSDSEGEIEANDEMKDLAMMRATEELDSENLQDTSSISQSEDFETNVQQETVCQESSHLIEKKPILQTEKEIEGKERREDEIMPGVNRYKSKKKKIKGKKKSRHQDLFPESSLVNNEKLEQHKTKVDHFKREIRLRPKHYNTCKKLSQDTLRRMGAHSDLGNSKWQYIKGSNNIKLEPTVLPLRYNQEFNHAYRQTGKLRIPYKVESTSSKLHSKYLVHDKRRKTKRSPKPDADRETSDTTSNQSYITSLGSALTNFSNDPSSVTCAESNSQILEYTDSDLNSYQGMTSSKYEGKQFLPPPHFKTEKNRQLKQRIRAHTNIRKLEREAKNDTLVADSKKHDMAMEKNEIVDNVNLEAGFIKNGKNQTNTPGSEIKVDHPSPGTEARKNPDMHVRDIEKEKNFEIERRAIDDSKNRKNNVSILYVDTKSPSTSVELKNTKPNIPSMREDKSEHMEQQSETGTSVSEKIANSNIPNNKQKLETSTRDDATYPKTNSRMITDNALKTPPEGTTAIIDNSKQEIVDGKLGIENQNESLKYSDKQADQIQVMLSDTTAIWFSGEEESEVIMPVTPVPKDKSIANVDNFKKESTDGRYRNGNDSGRSKPDNKVEVNAEGVFSGIGSSNWFTGDEDLEAEIAGVILSPEIHPNDISNLSSPTSDRRNSIEKFQGRIDNVIRTTKQRSENKFEGQAQDIKSETGSDAWYTGDEELKEDITDPQTSKVQDSNVGRRLSQNKFKISSRISEPKDIRKSESGEENSITTKEVKPKTQEKKPTEKNSQASSIPGKPTHVFEITKADVSKIQMLDAQFGVEYQSKREKTGERVEDQVRDPQCGVGLDIWNTGQEEFKEDTGNTERKIHHLNNNAKRYSKDESNNPSRMLELRDIRTCDNSERISNIVSDTVKPRTQENNIMNNTQESTTKSKPIATSANSEKEKLEGRNKYQEAGRNSTVGGQTWVIKSGNDSDIWYTEENLRENNAISKTHTIHANNNARRNAHKKLNNISQTHQYEDTHERKKCETESNITTRIMLQEKSTAIDDNSTQGKPELVQNCMELNKAKWTVAKQENQHQENDSGTSSFIMGDAKVFAEEKSVLEKQSRNIVVLSTVNREAKPTSSMKTIKQDMGELCDRESGKRNSIVKLQIPGLETDSGHCSETKFNTQSFGDKTFGWKNYSRFINNNIELLSSKAGKKEEDDRSINPPSTINEENISEDNSDNSTSVKHDLRQRYVEPECARLNSQVMYTNESSISETGICTDTFDRSQVLEERLREQELRVRSKNQTTNSTEARENITVRETANQGMRFDNPNLGKLLESCSDTKCASAVGVDTKTWEKRSKGLDKNMMGTRYNPRIRTLHEDQDMGEASIILTNMSLDDESTVGDSRNDITRPRIKENTLRRQNSDPNYTVPNQNQLIKDSEYCTEKRCQVIRSDEKSLDEYQSEKSTEPSKITNNKLQKINKNLETDSREPFQTKNIIEQSRDTPNRANVHGNTPRQVYNGNRFEHAKVELQRTDSREPIATKTMREQSPVPPNRTNRHGNTDQRVNNGNRFDTNNLDLQRGVAKYGNNFNRKERDLEMCSDGRCPSEISQISGWKKNGDLQGISSNFTNVPLHGNVVSGQSTAPPERMNLQDTPAIRVNNHNKLKPARNERKLQTDIEKPRSNVQSKKPCSKQEADREKCSYMCCPSETSKNQIDKQSNVCSDIICPSETSKNQIDRQSNICSDILCSSEISKNQTDRLSNICSDIKCPSEVSKIQIDRQSNICSDILCPSEDSKIPIYKELENCSEVCCSPEPSVVMKRRDPEICSDIWCPSQASNNPMDRDVEKYSDNSRRPEVKKKPKDSDAEICSNMQCPSVTSKDPYGTDNTQRDLQGININLKKDSKVSIRVKIEARQTSFRSDRMNKQDNSPLRTNDRNQVSPERKVNKLHLQDNVPKNAQKDMPTVFKKCSDAWCPSESSKEPSKNLHDTNKYLTTDSREPFLKNMRDQASVPPDRMNPQDNSTLRMNDRNRFSLERRENKPHLEGGVNNNVWNTKRRECYDGACKLENRKGLSNNTNRNLQETEDKLATDFRESSPTKNMREQSPVLPDRMNRHMNSKQDFDNRAFKPGIQDEMNEMSEKSGKNGVMVGMDVCSNIECPTQACKIFSRILKEIRNNGTTGANDSKNVVKNNMRDLRVDSPNTFKHESIQSNFDAQANVKTGTNVEKKGLRKELDVCSHSQCTAECSEIDMQGKVNTGTNFEGKRMSKELDVCSLSQCTAECSEIDMHGKVNTGTNFEGKRMSKELDVCSHSQCTEKCSEIEWTTNDPRGITQNPQMDLNPRGKSKNLNHNSSNFLPKLTHQGMQTQSADYLKPKSAAKKYRVDSLSDTETSRSGTYDEDGGREFEKCSDKWCPSTATTGINTNQDKEQDNDRNRFKGEVDKCSDKCRRTDVDHSSNEHKKENNDIDLYLREFVKSLGIDWREQLRRRTLEEHSKALPKRMDRGGTSPPNYNSRKPLQRDAAENNANRQLSEAKSETSTDIKRGESNTEVCCGRCCSSESCKVQNCTQEVNSKGELKSPRTVGGGKHLTESTIPCNNSPIDKCGQEERGRDCVDNTSSPSEIGSEKKKMGEICSDRWCPRASCRLETLDDIFANLEDKIIREIKKDIQNDSLNSATKHENCTMESCSELLCPRVMESCSESLCPGAALQDDRIRMEREEKALKRKAREKQLERLIRKQLESEFGVPDRQENEETNQQTGTTYPKRPGSERNQNKRIPGERDNRLYRRSCGAKSRTRVKSQNRLSEWNICTEPGTSNMECPVAGRAMIKSIPLRSQPKGRYLCKSHSPNVSRSHSLQSTGISMSHKMHEESSSSFESFFREIELRSRFPEDCHSGLQICENWLETNYNNNAKENKKDARNEKRKKH